MPRRGAVNDAEGEELDAVPPPAFVRARNALAARLRKAGRGREASEVARRRRPGVAVWLVNRLARTDAAGVRGLIEAAEGLRRAHLREPRAIGDAALRHRAALQRLMPSPRARRAAPKRKKLSV
jgi:hypothetical protein